MTHRALQFELKAMTHRVLLTYASGAGVTPVVVTTLATVTTSATFNTLALTVELQTHTEGKLVVNLTQHTQLLNGYISSLFIRGGLDTGGRAILTYHILIRSDVQLRYL